MTGSPILELNDGHAMPQLGLGTYRIADEDAPAAVKAAVDIGYALVDTAAVYGNETGVGKALAGTRGIFLTTKLWNESQGFERAKKAFEKSLGRLGREVDLLLIHWPCPEKHLFLDTWKAFIDLREEGKVRSIGVSNFRRDELDRLVSETGIVPAVNQVELHPRFQQRELRALHADLGIVTQSWSPLGQGHGMEQEVIRAIAEESGQSAAAVIIRWHLQHGFAVIPKASSSAHMADNFSATQFELTGEQMGRIDALDDRHGRIGPDPATFC